MNKSFQKQGKKLIIESGLIFKRDVISAFDNQDFNMSVRRSQEVVELCLKGALKMLGIDYPKVHDVAIVFSKQAMAKQLKADEKILKKNERISLWLSQARIPAFYGERDYGAQDADVAVSDARFVLNEIKKMMNLSEH